jgi:hypothetical protein
MPAKKTKMGIAVAVALEALRNPAVQNALKQAPATVARLRKSVEERKYTTGTSGTTTSGTGGSTGTRVAGIRIPKPSELYGQGRLEKRAANLRALVAELRALPSGPRVDPKVLRSVDDALDAIDVELRVAAHQDRRDRRRMHKRVGHALDELVDAIAVTNDSDSSVVEPAELPPPPPPPEAAPPLR